VQSRVWRKAVENSADPHRAKHYLEQLKATSAASGLKVASAEQARILSALFSGSQALSEGLIVHPDWIGTSLNAESLQHPRQEQGLRREVAGWLRPLLETRDYAAAFARLREFKQREMLRIAARDLARLGNVNAITREISTVADVCLDSAYQLCRQQVVERLGTPWHQDATGRWQPTEFCLFGLGKLGGQELNYSSDVDLIFVYSEEGFAFKEPPRSGQGGGRGPSSHQFFKRLIEAFVAEVTRMTSEGMLFRIDLRLRPEGDAGPLARSLASYENFYAQWGQTWERMMLIKARRVAGDTSLASEFLEMIQPFRYPRSLSERTLREIAEMKDRIENEVVKAGEIDRNVKLGRGGIREIEFVAQALQLLNAGRTPFLQSPHTLPTLEKLVQYRLLPTEDATALAEAYAVLRDVEHRLQMENNLQTHTIPTERKARERLAALMGFDSLKSFETALSEHTRTVRRVYDSLLKSYAPAAKSPLPRSFTSHEAEWNKLLAAHSFQDIEKSLRIIETLVLGPGYIHVSPRTVDLAMQLLPRLLAMCPKREGSRTVMPPKALSDPDRVLARLDSFVTAYGTRAMLYETWAGNPTLFELLLLLFDRSEFLAETAIRTPDLVDELELSGRLRRRKNAAEILKDLRHGLKDKDQKLWLRRYHETELMRIGLRDILGLADFEQNLVELSALADACLQYALEVVLRRNRLKSAPFVIIGLGKLGGAELNYGSDLDIVFVADNKVKNLPALQKLAVEVMDLLSGKTELGVAFETDARLRPDGEKGLLANTLNAYEEYYRRRAMFWEIQTLTRTRPIAGDLKLGEQFQELAARLTSLAQPSLPLTAFRPDWKSEIARMRRRIEKERTPTGKNDLALKTGAGGLIDAEFVAQALCLAQGWQEANTLRALQLAREKKALANSDADLLIENYRQLRRIEGILRRWSFAGETVLPEDPAPLYRVAVRCGFADSDSFMKAVTGYRAAIRSVYNKVFQTR
jgi:[glutamine synthetase] adenylyltransferase / [glutamine synthetase]-adenylyl-L-tyrosine phosphorylase